MDVMGSFAGAMGDYELNPVRGCGTKKPGGAYLEAMSGPGGTLNRLTWVLGEHTHDGANIFTATSERSMTFINPAATLATGEIVPLGPPGADPDWDVEKFKRRYHQFWPAVGNVGLLDFVGASHYTPWSFAKEVWALGPSRRVTPDFLEAIAPHLPLPVFFCHPQMPVFDHVDYMRENAVAFGEEFAGYMNEPPTWERERWGMSIGHYMGDDHLMIPVLMAQDQDQLHSADGGVMFEQTLFLASWFTCGTYVKRHDDDEGIDAVNVRNVRLGDDEEE